MKRLVVAGFGAGGGREELRWHSWYLIPEFLFPP